MHTRTTKTLFAIVFRSISVLMILSMLLANVGISPAHAASTVTISGSVGVAGAGATITANGNSGYDDSSTVANGSGIYSVTVDTNWLYQRWSGTVTPSKAGFAFSPSSRNYSNITTNQAGQNYTATPVTYTISGSVGSAGGGATITYSGGSTTANVTTGNYSFTVAYGWSGTVTPSKTGYTFTPASRTYSNVTANDSGENYTATSTALTISGNAGVGSATITYTGGSTTANSSGVYSFTVSPGWSGTVSPSRTGFAFWPASTNYNNVTTNQTSQNYTARPTSFTFGSFGDSHNEVYFGDNPDIPGTAQQLASLNPALVLGIGDVEDNGFSTGEMGQVVGVLKAKNLFDKTFLVRGNHDDKMDGSAAGWESYLETSPNIPTRPAYVANKVALNSSSDNLTYSFDYGNSIFIGLDVPGDIGGAGGSQLLTDDELNFLDARLTYAENAGLTHAFVFFHGPAYCVEQTHCASSTRNDSSSTPPALMNVINSHPIVSATFHGHEHVLAWTHMDNTRVSVLTRSYEQFVTSPAGASSYDDVIWPDRVDAYAVMADDDQGFATISVDGLSFTVNFYKNGTVTPELIWSHTFSKVNTPPTISDITDKTANEDIATGAIPFTVGDVELNPAYLTVTASSSDPTLVPEGNISLAGSGVNRTVDITPGANQSGTATITVSVNDGNVTVSDTFLLTVSPVNDAPTADPQGVSMSWNTSLNIILTGSDVEGSPLTFEIVDAPAHGSLSGSDASRTYTPTTGYSGTDSFTFKANDGTADSVPGSVSINITAYTISGNTGVGGATLSYTDGTPKTVAADGSGLYSFQVPIGWSGTVTPSKAGYNFTPSSMSYVDVQADQTDQNYATSGVMLTISGNAGVAGASLSYTDGTPKTVTADEAGLYSFEVPYNWSGTVTPSKTGYGFRPASRSYTNLTLNQDSQDYITTTARVYYVDKTNPACTDVGTVGSMAVPFCTITRGAYLAQPGQIVHVLHGTYAETVYPERSGTEGNPITYWADPGVTVTGQSSQTTAYPAFGLSGDNYIVIDGFNITNTGGQGIYIYGADHVILQNNQVSYAGLNFTSHPYTQGIYMRDAINSTITGNITHHNTCIGIRVVGGDHNLISNNTSYENFSLVETDAAGIELTGSSYNTVVNNLVYSNEDSGINLYYWDGHGGATNNVIIGNLSYENGDHGIDNYQSPNNTIIGNTIQGNGTVGINFEGNTPALGSFGAVVANNIMSHNGITPPSGSWGGNLRFDANSTAGSSTDYNLFYRTRTPPALQATVQIIWNNVNYTDLATFKTAVTGQEVHGLEGDPLFVGPVAPVLRQTGVPYNGLGVFGNYYTSPGSPAIDSANADAPNWPATDIDGNSRIDDPATPNTGSGTRTYDDRGAYEYLPAGPSIPVVTTQAVTAITPTTATGNGTLTAPGLPNPTQHGVVWSTSLNPTTDDNKTTDGPLSVTGAFTSSMTGLIPGTLYHVRAYATNDVGTAYGEDVTFTSYLTSNVTTQAVTNITTTTATGNGNVTSLGVPNPTEHGVVWSTSPNPTTADNKTTDGPVSAIGAFTSNITGLTPGTLYYVRAYVTNGAGTSYGSDFTFTTHVAPSITTLAVTGITTTTATGNGNVTALGIPNPTQHGVVWSTSANPTTADNKTTDGPLAATGAFTSNITGLAPGTLYHLRAYATNEVGTIYGEDVTFTALQLPTVTTQPATNITTTTATGNGNITGLGVPNPTEHGVVWSMIANPTIADNKTADGAVSATGTYISSITGLTPGTLYHVRAYATNAAGTSYGNDITFTTDILPTVTTQAVTNITQTTATGNGNVTSLGVPNPTEHGVVWSTLVDPTTADNKTTDGPVSATGAFTSSITGLTPGTLYHVRAYATNEVGTVYGEDVTFTTLLLPTVTTQAVADITVTTATGNGNVTALGIPNPTQHGLVWSTLLNPTTADSKTTNGAVSATGAFTGNITGLTPGTLYHVRAYATNTAGTVYGEDVTFITLLTPSLTTQDVTDITQTTATGNGSITGLGSSNPTEHGVVWSTSPNPTTADYKTTDGPVSVTGAFTSSITGLTPGTLYHVRAYAINAAGTSYGNDVTFTTLLLPTVTTQAPTDITQTTATGNGNINVLGIPNPTQHGMVWSTSPNPTTADSKTTNGIASATGAFTSNMTGLNIGTQYYVRAYATNAAGTVYGNEVTFTTVSTSTGTTTPLTNAGAGASVSGPGTAIWLNPGYITADDTNYAQVTVNAATSQYLQGTNYGFAIPANATINGITVTIGRYESGQSGGNDVRDVSVNLLKNDVITGSNKAAASTEWPLTEPVNAIYGSNSDLWGATWTAAEINASNFGVALSVNSANNRTAYVDTMQVSVTYTVSVVGSITTVNCGAGTPVAIYGSSIICVATVTRGSGAFTPSGDVTWTTSGTGSFVTSPCSLAGAEGTATCSITYTPSLVGSGSHLITANYAGDGSFYASSGSQTVTVNKLTASVTPDDASKIYGEADPVFTGTLTGFLPADHVTATYSRAAGDTFAGSPYTISATLSPTDVLANYNITYNTADFTIIRKDASVTPDVASKIYGATEPAFSGTLTGFLTADDVTATYSRTAGETVAGGPYTISAALSPAGVLGNYNITYNTADFTITAKDASVTPDAASKIYGEADPELTGVLSGFLFADGVTATYSRVAGETVAGGPYAISATLSPAGVLGNYNITYNTADFTITARPVTVTADAGQSKVFGADDPVFTYTASDTNAIFTGVLDREPGLNVGSYAIGQGTLAVVGSNYSMSFVSTDFSITPRPITITPDAGQSKVFGASDPLPFTYTHTELLGTDTITGTLGRVTGENAGTYAYSLDALDAGSNYTLTMTSDPATFSITAMPVTITPDAGQTKVFGAADPAFTYTHTALLGTDTINGTLGRLPGEDVASYAYTLGSLDAGLNYALSMASDPATFAITAKPITVTADAGQSKVLGAADPIFAYTSSDPIATFTGALGREVGETVGTYAITQGTLDAGINYSISFVSSLFTITPPLDDYTLTLTPDEHGTIAASPDNPYYHYGDVVTFTATANPGWAFANWSGDLVSSNNPDSLAIHGNTTVTANYVAVSVAPSFSSTPVTSVDEDALYTYNITATDPNLGDILAISAETKPAWLAFTDNGNGSATLTGTPTNAEVGNHDVVLRVSDGTLTTDQSFSITVANTNDAPSFTSSAVTSAVEDTAYTYDITVNDPDAGATLAITAPVKPEWLTLTDNGNGTAVLAGTPANANVGIHNVTLRVNDGTVDIDQNFTIDVGNTNDGPSFTSTPITGVDEDAAYAYNITASDPDTGAVLTITAPTLPAWLTFADNGNGTASLTGTPTNNEVGDHPVVLQVSDGTELASQPFTITVANTNDAPVLAQPADQTNEQGKAASLQLSGTDIDLGNTLTYSASGLPEGLSINTETGLISGTITGALGTYPITAGVDDGHGGTDSKTFSWNVTPPTYTLTITIIGNGTVTKDPDQASYLNGTQVTLTPAPAAGWRLDHWSENVVDGKVTIDGDTAVTATFTQNEYTLTVISDHGMVTRDNPGPYHLNDVVVLTAVADDGWSFSSWTGCTGTDNTCSVTMDGNRTVTANYGLFPGAFNKLAPANGATNMPTSLTLYWSASSGMTSYEYCVDATNDNVCSSSWVNNGNQRSVTLSGLNNNTTYYWQVRAKNSGGATYADGTSTVFWSFTVKVPPAAFTKLSPANGIQNAGTTLTLYWTASSGMTSYEYCLDTTNDNACTSSWVNNGNQRSVTLSGLNNTTTYYWQVRAKNGNGTTYADGAVGSFWSFTVNVSPGAFTKTAPANGIQNVGTTVTLYWAASPYMTSYEYCVDTTNDNACTSSWVNNANLRSVTLSNLNRGTTYYWQVRAKNSVGSAYADGAVTAFWSFTVNVPPDPFTKLAPLTGAMVQGTTVTLYWSSSPGMASYEYCLDATNDNACTSSWVNNTNQRSVTLTGLNPGATYYWQVRAKNSTGTTYADGAVGSFWSFTVSAPPGAFHKTAPANGTQNVGTSVSLYWTSSSNRTSFEYCYDMTDDGQCTNWVSTGTVRSVTISGLAANTTYYWQVRAKNNSGTTYADEGVYWAFTTIP